MHLHFIDKSIVTSVCQSIAGSIELNTVAEIADDVREPQT
jgi:hypothetical protein